MAAKRSSESPESEKKHVYTGWDGIRAWLSDVGPSYVAQFQQSYAETSKKPQMDVWRLQFLIQVRGFPLPAGQDVTCLCRALALYLTKHCTVPSHTVLFRVFSPYEVESGPIGGKNGPKTNHLFVDVTITTDAWMDV